MSFKEKLALTTGIDSSKLPSSYQIIGDIFLAKLPKIKSATDRKKIASGVVKILPYIKTVCEIKGVSGELRKPKIRVILGRSTETIHKENGCLFKIDVSKIMFSKGNLSERKRLLGEVKKGEVVVDMFAGIGYFSVPPAKFSSAGKIYSIEKNKESFGYLKENVLLNKIKNIEPLLGDCRKIKTPEKADRVLMGYLPKTYLFLPAAFGFLKDSGIINYHDTFSKGELWEKPVSTLEKEAGKSGFKLKKILEKKIVKDYAPNVCHVVVDAEFEKV